MSVSKSRDQRLQEQVDQIDNLKRQQMSGDVKKISGNVDKDYELPENEKHLVHLKCITRTNNPEKADYDNSTRINKFEPDRFKRMEKQGAFNRYWKVEILHDPSQQKESKPKK